MKKIKISFISSLFLATAGLVTTASFAADVAAGKAKAAMCAGCHGPKGISMIPTYPNLAGQKEQYLALQLKAFRDGERKSMLMEPMSKGLSDADIANISAYYAKLDPTGK